MRAAFRWMLLIGVLAANVQMVRGIIWGPASDTSHPDFAQLSSQFEQTRAAFDREFHWRRENPLVKREEHHPVIDLASVNRGSWKKACLYGGYTSPINAMRESGAIIGIVDILRFEFPMYSFFSVHEYATMISFIDQNNKAHFIHFRKAIGAETQHVEKCAVKPNTKVVLDGYSDR